MLFAHSHVFKGRIGALIQLATQSGEPRHVVRVLGVLASLGDVIEARDALAALAPMLSGLASTWADHGVSSCQGVWR